MSGPKVIRIVTREELIAISKRHLAKLDESVAEWMRVCESKGLVELKEIDSVRKRQTEIHALLNTEKLTTIQKHVAQEIEYLRRDVEKRIEIAAGLAAKAKTMRRGLVNTAATLIESISNRKIHVPEDLLESLKAAKNDLAKGPEAAERAINKAIDFLAPESLRNQVSKRQREIAQKLIDGQEATPNSRLPVGLTTSIDDTCIRIDRLIAELEIETSPALVAPYIKRAEAINIEPSSDRRKLLTDSLTFDLAEKARERQKRDKLFRELTVLVSELRTFDSKAAETFSEHINQLREVVDITIANRLIQDIKSRIEDKQKKLAEKSRRDAVLRALSSIGYEVREGMMTALAENGSVTMHKPTNTDYGIELVGSGDAGRFQFRVVAFRSAGMPINVARDIAMENIWCSDLEKIKTIVAEEGGDISIVKAKQAGEIPIKIVEIAELDRHDRHAPVSVIKPKTLK